MRMYLGRWGGLIEHVFWRLGIMLPLLFTQYDTEEESHAERSLSGWKLSLIALLVIIVSIWSFFW